MELTGEGLLLAAVLIAPWVYGSVEDSVRYALGAVLLVASGLFCRLEGGSDHYLSVGWNLKFTDLQAVIGRSQMRRLPALVERKRAIFAQYLERLAGISGLEIPSTDLSNVTPWFIDVLVDSARKRPLMDHLRANGIGSREFYPPLHAEPAFARSESFPVAEAISARGLWLPSSLHLSDDDVARVCHLVRVGLQRAT